MLYLANPSSPKVRDAMRAGELGQMCTPAEGRMPLPDVEWAADTGCYSRKGYPGDARWIAWLEKLLPWRENCLFVSAPDRFEPALGERMGSASLERSRPWLPLIRNLGYPAALVAQNGLTVEDVPWHEIDALFVGGTTEWKLSRAAHRLEIAAKEHGKHLHVGRVNSARRWQITELFGCDTADGTFITYGPDQNLDRQARWPVPNLFGGQP
ncbi:hypothetical protein [Amycolatopsis australiensis]|uniref:Uncharacterized protein n=1 Tax=Amycolatopsis australiensis TaxID=546364 RepID=A0A1K1LPH8_9PSEU|nr:hypothetical protein [Amycolatopsis australiensis]SFW12784.1 hypothetical protein SAMN04489730_0111 [Amycolatopsis australiensis]